MKALVLYMPVLHQGYLDLLDRHADADELYLWGNNVRAEFRPLQKDIRGIGSWCMVEALRALRDRWAFKVIDVMDEPDDLLRLRQYAQLVMLPDEVSTQMAAILSLTNVTYDNAFLRWHSDRIRTPAEVTPDRYSTRDHLPRGVLALAEAERDQSADWWRQIGGVLWLADETVVGSAHNHHVPDEYQPYIDGDPRASASRGELIDLSTAIHAEVELIAQAARRGVALAGSSMLVTTFPCPTCAKLIGAAGIKTCYFLDGYSMLDGERVLRHFGVELVKLT